MARREKPIEHSGACAQLAKGLRDLRLRAGTPTYRALAQKCSFSASVLSRAMDGKTLPTWYVVQALVTAFGGNPAEWIDRWEAARHEGKELPQEPMGTSPAAVLRGRVTPEDVRSPEDLARAMRAIKDASGLSLRQITRSGSLSRSAIADMCQPSDVQHLPSQATIEAFLGVMDPLLAEGEKGAWLACWSRLHHRQAALRERKPRKRGDLTRIISRDLPMAIDNGQLSLAFQPMVTLPQVRPVGVEALLRWHHPELGVVPPWEVVTAAEKSGQMPALGRWVLDRTCEQLARWSGSGIFASVNVSPAELGLSYLDHLSEILTRWDIKPSQLVLELDEYSVMSELDRYRDQLTRLQDLGVRIAIDSFGTGYTNLGQLAHAPISMLKVDSSFARDPAILDVIARMGHRLGYIVICTGISNPETRRAAEMAGCPYGQGLLFGHAVPPEFIDALLAAMP